MVLVDTDKHKVVGTSGIVASVGCRHPFYTYKINTEVHYSESMDIYRKHQFLTLTNDYTGASELCTLFLSNSHRGKGNGLLLSASRFLLVAQFPHRFGNKIIAEMRGVSDEHGRSPFWESVGRHFFGSSFSIADKANGEGNAQFIAELIHHHPIYLSLLPESAKQVIGQVHEHTVPALNMLKKEGFEYTGYVDIFDGGATIEVKTNNVKSIIQSQVYKVSIGQINKKNTFNAMASNCELLDFRATLCQLNAASLNDDIIITQEMADLLMVRQNDFIRGSI